MTIFVPAAEREALRGRQAILAVASSDFLFVEKVAPHS